MDVLFQDAEVVVINKPSGMIVHRGWGTDRDNAVALVSKEIGERVFPVHRLDRGTSGVLLFARTQESASILGKAIASGELRKVYLALVRGVPPAEGVIDHPIKKEKRDGPRVEARTRFRLIAASPIERCALVELIPETGRLHQIRRHLKHLSHPLIGDVNYGKGDINRHYRERYALHRLALHAKELEFAHPKSGERLRFVAPMPEDLRNALVALGLPA